MMKTAVTKTNLSGDFGQHSFYIKNCQVVSLCTPMSWSKISISEEVYKLMPTKKQKGLHLITKNLKPKSDK